MNLERYSFIIALIFAVCIGMFAEYGMRIGIAPCHPIVLVDSLVQSERDTVTIENIKTVVRRVISQKIDTMWLTDTLRILPDSLSVATIDTIMSDGARIGLDIRAALIVPPMQTRIAYAPAPRIERTITVPIVEYRTDWRLVAIGSMAGMLTGVLAEKVASR